MPWQVGVEPCMEELAQRIGNGGIFDAAEMHGDVAAPCIVAKHAGREVPARIAVAREVRTIEAGAQGPGNKHRQGITIIGRCGL